jgi:hypothetical protein
MEKTNNETGPLKDCGDEGKEKIRQSPTVCFEKGKTVKRKKVLTINSDSSDDETGKPKPEIVNVEHPTNVEQKNSDVRRRFYANCDATYRSSWHGSLPKPQTEPEMAGGATSHITVRSRSHGNLQQKSKLNFFKRKSFPVNPSPPPSPSKSGQLGFKSLFQNIKRIKKSNNSDKDARNKKSVTNEQVVVNTETDIDQTDKKSVRNSAEIQPADSFRNRSHHTQCSDTGLVVQHTPTLNTDNQLQCQIVNDTQPEGLHSSSVETCTRTHPIHTFQLTQCRNIENLPLRASSIFGRARSKKSVIKETEENLTHPGVIVLLSVINFILWMFLFSVKFLRYTAKVSIWIWLKLLYSFDFIIKLFYRIFNIDPEKANQNSDFSHIESKYIILFLFHDVKASVVEGLESMTSNPVTSLAWVRSPGDALVV